MKKSKQKIVYSPTVYGLYSPKSDLKQILNTPEAKKAWSHDYITSNKLTFPNNQ